MGALMYASHASYTACGLASGGTDLIVELVQQARPSSGLYGAKSQAAVAGEPWRFLVERMLRTPLSV